MPKQPEREESEQEDPEVEVDPEQPTSLFGDDEELDTNEGDLDDEDDIQEEEIDLDDLSAMEGPDA